MELAKLLNFPTRQLGLFANGQERVDYLTDWVSIDDRLIPRFSGEYWTSKQRQAAAIHEISYRACFKPQLPRFFIQQLTSEGERVYDPFSGRGTTLIEAGLLGRLVAANDINPLSRILALPRLFVPEIDEIHERLKSIEVTKNVKAEIDLSMFYHPDTEAEIVSLREYLDSRLSTGTQDKIDLWIRMVATNRLTGHSKGFFSVYTLPPNQAVSPDSQRRINEKLKQTPPYRDVRAIIIAKSKSLVRGLTKEQKRNLKLAGKGAVYLTKDAADTPDIPSESISLTVTSPPFLDIVQYATDNWLRVWFNKIDVDQVSKHITTTATVEEWSDKMLAVFYELFRVTKLNGWVAFEVGEIRNGTLRLDEHVVPLGERAGFHCEGILVNLQVFTKTSNIWGVRNNRSGTNTNRIVLFRKIDKCDLRPFVWPVKVKVKRARSKLPFWQHSVQRTPVASCNRERCAVV